MEKVRSMLLFMLCILLMGVAITSCSTDDEPDSGSDSKTTTIVGSWYDESFSSIITSYNLYVFDNDGGVKYFYKYKYRDHDTQCIIRSGTYSIDETNIEIDFDNGTTMTGTYSIDDNVLVIKRKTGSIYGEFYRHTLTDLDNIVIGNSYIDKPTQGSGDNISDNSPYLNYIYCESWKGKGYVELTKVEMQCEHGQGTSANFKYLRFCGPNGNVSPDGAVILYSTPYYEGIDKYWPDGTYDINVGTGYWHYIIHPFINGYNAVYHESDGTLTIKTNGNNMTIDYKSDNIRIHFFGSVIK